MNLVAPKARAKYEHLFNERPQIETLKPRIVRIGNWKYLSQSTTSVSLFPYVCVSPCLSVSLIVGLPVCMYLIVSFLVSMSQCLSFCVSVCLSVSLSICPSIHLSVCPSICLTVSLSVLLSIRPPVQPFIQSSWCKGISETRIRISKPMHLMHALTARSKK
jgi:hypothetical protein